MGGESELRKEVGCSANQRRIVGTLGLVGGLASLKPGSEQKQPPFITVPEAKSSWTLITSDISQFKKKKKAF